MHVAGNFTAEECACRAHLTERILDEVRRAHQQRPVDLFISYFYNAHFDPAGFDELRRLGIRSVNFFCNSIYQFELVREVAKGADFAWHAEQLAREKYLAAGARPLWVQMGADPDVYSPVRDQTQEYASCFVGQRYADRDRWVAALIRSGIPVDLYGVGWKALPRGSNGNGAGAADRPASYLGRPVSVAGSKSAYLELLVRTFLRDGALRGGRRIMRQWAYRRETRALDPIVAPYSRGRAGSIAGTFAQYHVVLNFSNVWADGAPGSPLIPHVRLRDFEGPMCGACYITGHTDEITAFYEIGKEIDTYRSREELIDKCRFYLRHPSAAGRMRNAGFQRAQRDHTWVRRFMQLFAGTCE